MTLANNLISLIFTPQQAGLVWLRFNLLGVLTLLGLAGL
jgi:hypothetical protein